MAFTIRSLLKVCTGFYWGVSVQFQLTIKLLKALCSLPFPIPVMLYFVLVYHIKSKKKTHMTVKCQHMRRFKGCEYFCKVLCQKDEMCAYTHQVGLQQDVGLCCVLSLIHLIFSSEHDIYSLDLIYYIHHQTKRKVEYCLTFLSPTVFLLPDWNKDGCLNVLNVTHCCEQNKHRGEKRQQKNKTKALSAYLVQTVLGGWLRLGSGRMAARTFTLLRVRRAACPKQQRVQRHILSL